MGAEGPQREGEDDPSVAVVGRAQRGRVAVAEPPRQLGLRLGGIEGRIRPAGTSVAGRAARGR